MLYGRASEEQRIRVLLEEAVKGSSGSLVLTGEPGAGKSALLDVASGLADDSWRVLRSTGVESESELPFAGLQLLLASALGGLDALPSNQADALRCAFGYGGPHRTADRFLVGLGTLSLLAELSGAGPVLCLVDDAHWLDQPSIDALVFAARRLGAEGVVVLLAGREEFSAPGLSQLRLTPLAADAARDLVVANAPGLSPEVLERVLAESAGNPLALLELPRMDLDARSLGPLPLPDRLRAGYQRDIANQPESVRTVLLVAAAEETGELALVLRVLADLGLTDEALAAAEPTGMLTVSAQSVTFRHPLRRAAVYDLATFTRRRAVHTAIAAALAEEPDRRAWHLAAAATGPDEQIAAALEAAAENACSRTGFATAATALERSARLTPDATERVRRLVRAVEVSADAGRRDDTLRLIAAAEQSAADPLARARIASVRARLEIEAGSLSAAYELLLAAAGTVAAIEPRTATAMLVEAAVAAWTAGDLNGVAAVRARMVEVASGPADAASLALLDGPLGLNSPDPAAGVRLIRANVAHIWSMPAEMPSMRLMAARQAALASDVDDARAILLELNRECRDRGMVGWMPVVGCNLGAAELLIGNFRESDAVVNDALRTAEDIGQPDVVRRARSILSILAAIRGEEERCRDLAADTLGVNAVGSAQAGWALALLDLGYGRYEEVLDRLAALSRVANHALGQWVHLTSDYVEAAVRLRSPERATGPTAELEQWFAATGSPWVQAHVLRCRAMLDDDGELFARALTLHAAQGRWFDHARTGLLYGEWLRRARRQRQARSELRKALETFERLGAQPWAERARNELRAAGEGTVGRTASDLTALLTSQEFQVVRLAAAGATNKEIGAQLFMSPKTVGNHLYRAFPKLGVSSRVALARLELD
ncbi:helix-turn-helix transcriptional regulator [Nocardia vinacea]|uniref:helix-turn-helix transcriptional regulator n=1 Tax=Nocardia vinacea TaxID=96468 RepID=UPI0002DD841D|nr:helix-turn-helix transcriptional regulator [Nocardia vinacea]